MLPPMEFLLLIIALVWKFSQRIKNQNCKNTSQEKGRCLVLNFPLLREASFQAQQESSPSVIKDNVRFTGTYHFKCIYLFLHLHVVHVCLSTGTCSHQEKMILVHTRIIFFILAGASPCGLSMYCNQKCYALPIIWK